MPAIAGVAQGAMVLEDVAIQNVTVDQFLRVTKPKVDGSIYLSDLFQENIGLLCVLLIRVVCGWTPWASKLRSGNTFMASLAERRRRRGLAASVIDIGTVLGVGYIT